MKKFFLLIILIPHIAFALDSKSAQKLAHDPAWLKLLHYSHDILHRYRSSVDDPNFFLAKKGRTHPTEELLADVAAFTSNGPLTDDSAVCQFPARYSWLNEKLNLSQGQAVPRCDRYEEWKKKLNPDGVSLIFASYYFNNPASMYGHTFLKLKRKEYQQGSGLLDYTVNYSAIGNLHNGVTFALKGLLGGYYGRYATDPYYFKIQKYNNIESRDLWEYDLNFSPAELERLVQHLWELGPIQIRYFFINKNCSYQLLPVLEAAKPNLNLSAPFVIRAVPLDTLEEVLKQPDLVKNYSLRPSHVRTMLARRAELTPEEMKMAKTLALDQSGQQLSALETLPQDRQAKVLDSAFDYLRYKAGFFRDRPQLLQEKEQKLLTLRSQRPSSKIDPPNVAAGVPPPQAGHGTGQGQVLFGADRENSFEEVSVRGALHDQEADPTGYVPGSQLEMLHLRGRYTNQTGKLNLEQLSLVEVFSLVPWDTWIHPPSWRVWTGVDVAHDLYRDPRHSMEYGVKGGSGFTFFLSARKKSMLYVMWRGEFMGGSAFDKGYRMGLGGQSGLIVPVSSKLRLHASANALRFPAGHVGNVVRFYGAGSYNLTKNLEWRLIGERQNHYMEMRTGPTLYW